MTVGTVAYAAPEQLMGEEMDGRADQYALAATAYQLLTGSKLFPHSNPAVVISRHLNTPPPAVSQHRPELAKLDAVLAKALAKAPADRYAQCSDFAQALNGQADALPPSSHSAPTAKAKAAAPPAPKPRRSTPTSSPPKRNRLSEPRQEPAPRRRWMIPAALTATVAIAATAWAVLQRSPASRTSATSSSTTSLSPTLLAAYTVLRCARRQPPCSEHLPRAGTSSESADAGQLPAGMYSDS
jgi:serine/threonine-protein kinase